MSFQKISSFFQNTSFTHKKTGISALIISGLLLSSCADALIPDARNISIPAPQTANTRERGVNEGNDPIVYLPLGEDVLMPQTKSSAKLPDTIVGPYELRSESLAGALQLILDGTDIPVAFESDSSLDQNITVTNLKGPVSKIVNDVCSIANMYCSFENGVLVVKDREIFTVTIPPIVAKDDLTDLLTNIAAAIRGITGEEPITDKSTRTIVYRASQRTAEMAARYFQRLRTNTAMIVYETYIWEVTLDSGNTTGIKWEALSSADKFKFGININGAADNNLGSPISIGLPTTGRVNFSATDVFQFISSYGAVKTISQPQVSVLSGSTAKLRVADRENYVASVTKTAGTGVGVGDSFSTTTGTADTGFTLSIGSNWDNSTVYGTIDILLQEVKSIDTFKDNPDAIVQLPQTTERELNTSVRVRPGDMVLIAGMVRESDRFSKEGLGVNRPILPTSRSAATGNTELVFLLRPRVVVFTAPTADTPRNGSVPLPSQSFTQPSAGDISENVEEEKYMTKVDASVPNSIEIQPLASILDENAPAASQENIGSESAAPTVIVNYDILDKKK